MRTATLRTLIAASASAAMLFAATSCTEGDDPGPAPETATSTPTETAPAWQSEYTETQIAEYEAALERFNEYEERAEPIWASGKASPQTLAFFKDYFFAGEVMQSRLASYEASDVQIEGTATVLWSKPTRIKGQAVTIQQCVDPTSITATQKGEELTGGLDHPYLRTVSLSKPKDHPYLIEQIRDASQGKKVRRCAG